MGCHKPSPVLSQIRNMEYISHSASTALIAIIPVVYKMLGKVIVVVLVFWTASLAKRHSPLVEPFGSRIIGGKDTDISNYPWQASLQVRGSHICGAAIISDRWVLTAAHCVDTQTPSELTIVAGVTKLSDSSTQAQVRGVARYIKHENYNAGIFIIRNDIAAIELDEPLYFDAPGAPRAIPLAPSIHQDAVGSTCTITGWGHTTVNWIQGTHFIPDTLQEASGMRVLTTSECSNHFLFVDGSHICVDHTAMGACNGDSGGPLTCTKEGGVEYLYGVTSFGRQGCDPNGNPSVYTRTSYFSNWIYTTTGVAT